MVAPIGGVGGNSLYDNGSLTGSGPTDDAEWIELYNPSSCETVDISCYVLASNMGDSITPNWGTFLFPGGTTIPPLGHLVVGGNAAPNKDFNLINSINTQYCISPRWWLRDNAGWIGLYKQDGEPICGVYWTLTGSAASLYTDNVFNQDVITNPAICTCCGPEGYAKAKNIPNIEYVGNVISNTSFSFSRKTDGSPIWTLSSFGGTPRACNGGVDSCFHFSVEMDTLKPSCPSAENGAINVSISSNISSVEPLTYLWSNGDTIASLANLSAGNYSVTITDKYGCEYIRSVNLQSNPSLSLNLTSNSPVCNGDTLELYSNLLANNYNWTGPNGFVSTIQNPLLINTSNSNAGIYFLSITDTNGCTTNKTINIDVISDPICELGEKKEICNQEEIKIALNTESTNYTYNWFPVSCNNSVCNFDASYYFPSTISIYAQISACGKTAMDSLQIEILPCDLVIPNVITPNNDAFNENFVVQNLGFYPNSELLIFNRWGKNVFISSDYKNDWNGNNLSDGVYFYVLKVPMRNANSKEFHGTITIIGKR